MGRQASPWMHAAAAVNGWGRMGLLAVQGQRLATRNRGMTWRVRGGPLEVLAGAVLRGVVGCAVGGS